MVTCMAATFCIRRMMTMSQSWMLESQHHWTNVRLLLSVRLLALAKKLLWMLVSLCMLVRRARTLFARTLFWTDGEGGRILAAVQRIEHGTCTARLLSTQHGWLESSRVFGQCRKDAPFMSAGSEHQAVAHGHPGNNGQVSRADLVRHEASTSRVCIPVSPQAVGTMPFQSHVVCRTGLPSKVHGTFPLRQGGTVECGRHVWRSHVYPTDAWHEELQSTFVS